eukprot:TRINITY_DN12522_c0_g1_i2.p1 TRINITY_DN12522_c0_g1~~TRINITY_DN12522_c0_g1_i2.p1  ORF type:complete len:569 (+),score=109.15 TRINITY_DN12522_c0_g1_i2:66-1772(+)
MATRIGEKENSFLLKINTYNAYATEAALRKEIVKKMGQGLAGGKYTIDVPDRTEARLESTLPGLIRIGKNPKSEWAYFAFDCKESMERAQLFLTEMTGKRSQKWEITAGAQQDLDYFKKKRERDAEKSQKRKKYDSIREFTEPLHDQPYEAQLEKKKSNLIGTLRDMKTAIKKAWSHHPPTYLQDKPKIELEQLIPSPTINGYRNKVELTCGFGKTNEPTIGFLFGKTENEMGWIEEPYEMTIINDSMKSIIKHFSATLKETASTYPCYDKMSHTGMWRGMQIREGEESNNQVFMVEIQVNIPVSEIDGEKWTDLAGIVKASLTQLPSVVSIYMTSHTVLNNMVNEETSTTKLIHGQQFVYITALEKRFKISPRSFFQVNSRGNEVLLQAIRQYADLTENTVLLDLCCGTGTIGISLAKYVKRVVGVDMVASAIDDAKENAVRNNVTNTEYICGKVEDVIYAIKNSFSATDHVVAIVDPPRCGLHAKVLYFLRDSPINKFVYVSCRQQSLVQNTTLLTKPTSNNIIGAPFVPTKSLGVDLFPHCDQQEMVVLFERHMPTVGSEPVDEV